MAIHIPEHNLTFIHIPKTGGSSIQDWLLKNNKCVYPKKSVHWNVSQTKEHFVNVGKTFCVVRNPYDWMVSWFEYERKLTPRYIAKLGSIHKLNLEKETHNKELLIKKQSILDKGFKCYLLEYGINITSQYSWANNVDIVLRFHNLNNDFKQLFKTNTNLPTVNTTERQAWPSYYDKECKQIMLDYFSKDFTLL